jgi:arsenate reductase (glutaredoxin)
VGGEHRRRSRHREAAQHGRGQPRAHELGLQDLARDADAWIRMLAGNPELIQRPLVRTDDGRARVARDDETLSEVVAAGRGPTEG